MGRVLRVCPAVLMAFCLCGQAQQAAPVGGDTKPPPVSIRTQANLVLFDVVVTASHAVVHGLTKDQFHVIDNGVPQQLTVFEEHKQEAATATAEKPTTLGPNTYSNLPDVAEGSVANVLLLDALNTPVADQMQSKRQLIAYLKNVPPGTRIAVFTLASRLRMVSGFTTNAGALADLLHDKGKVAAQESALLDPQFSQTLSDQVTEMAGLGANAQAIASFQQFLADDAAFQADVRVKTTLDALQGLARYLQVIPGRKNLIWFSGSFPLAISGDSTLSSPFEAMRDYADQVRATDELLASARVAVYPVDARGMLTAPSADTSNTYQSSTTGLPSPTSGRGGRGGLGGSAANHSAGQAAITADNTALQKNMQEHATMQQIAKETGGEAFVNTNGLKEAVASVVANGSNYYTVGYVPTLKAYDGSFHRLKVTVDGQDEVAYRQGYYAEDPAKSKINPPVAQRAMAAALEQGAPSLSELLFKVRVQPGDAAGSVLATTTALAKPAASAGASKVPVKHYVVDYGIPARMVDFKASSDGVRHGRLELVLVAYNPDGKRVNLVDQNANFDFDPKLYDKVLQFGLPVHQEIDLPVGQIFLRIVVHDLSTEHVGAIEVPLVVAR